MLVEAPASIKSVPIGNLIKRVKKRLIVAKMRLVFSALQVIVGAIEKPQARIVQRRDRKIERHTKPRCLCPDLEISVIRVVSRNQDTASCAGSCLKLIYPGDSIFIINVGLGREIEILIK